MGPLAFNGPHAFAWDELVEALDVGVYPPPRVWNEASPTGPVIRAWWPGGANLKMRLGKSSIHFEELVSADPSKAAGLYTALVEALEPLMTSYGVPVATCEPATDEAREYLARRGGWDTGEGFWFWKTRELTVDEIADTYMLILGVRDERAAA